MRHIHAHPSHAEGSPNPQARLSIYTKVCTSFDSRVESSVSFRQFVSDHFPKLFTFCTKTCPRGVPKRFSSTQLFYTLFCSPKCPVCGLPLRKSSTGFCSTVCLLKSPNNGLHKRVVERQDFVVTRSRAATIEHAYGTKNPAARVTFYNAFSQTLKSTIGDFALNGAATVVLAREILLRDYPKIHSSLVRQFGLSFGVKTLFSYTFPSPLCSVCKNPSPSITYGHLHCSTECHNMACWGETHPNKTELVQEKVRVSSRKRFGTDYASQNSYVKAQKETTNLYRRGVKNPSACAVVKAKKVATNLAKRGVDNPAKDPEVLQRLKSTNIEIRGVPWPSQDPAVVQKARLTNQLRRGVDWPLQDPEVARKANWRGYTLYDVILEGRVFRVQGKLEVLVLKKLVSKFGVSNVHGQFCASFPKKLAKKRCAYRPDFYIKPLDKFVEVKSPWTLLQGHAGNQLSLNTSKAAKAGCNLRWLVGLRNGTLIPLPYDWYTWGLSRLTSLLNVSLKKEILDALSNKTAA